MIVRRIGEHREGVADGFTKKHRVHLLVYFEEFGDIAEAIAREKQLKHWNRAWKINLIETHNPNWHDLYPALGVG